MQRPLLVLLLTLAACSTPVPTVESDRPELPGPGDDVLRPGMFRITLYDENRTVVLRETFSRAEAEAAMSTSAAMLVRQWSSLDTLAAAAYLALVYNFNLSQPDSTHMMRFVWQGDTMETAVTYRDGDGFARVFDNRLDDTLFVEHDETEPDTLWSRLKKPGGLISAISIEAPGTQGPPSLMLRQQFSCEFSGLMAGALMVAGWEAYAAGQVGAALAAWLGGASAFVDASSDECQSVIASFLDQVGAGVSGYGEMVSRRPPLTGRWMSIWPSRLGLDKDRLWRILPKQ